MYALNLHLPVTQEEAQLTEARITESSSSLSAQKGFVSFFLLRPALPDKTYSALFIWQSRHDFEIWTQTDDFKHIFMGSNILSADNKTQLEAFEVVVAVPALSP